MSSAVPHRRACRGAGCVRSGSARLAHAGDETGRRVIVDVGKDGDLPAEPLDLRHLWQSLEAVVATLDIDVRMDDVDERLGCGLVEGDDMIDAAEGFEHAEPIVETVERPVRTLEPAHAVVAVDRH